MANRANDGITAAAPQGAVVTPVYARRNVMHWAVSENELENISFYNGLMATFSSLASFALGVALSIWVGVSSQKDRTATGDVLLDWGAPIMTVVAVAFLFLACLAYNARKNAITTIKKESGG